MNPVSRLFKKNAVCNIFSRNYAFKSDLKIKWVRPEKIASIRPEKSGDLKSSSIPDKSLLRYEFRHSKELESADEIVRKLFTLEFATKSDKNKVYREELIDDVKSHEFDSSSVEVRIAKWTGIIRDLQEYMEKKPHNKRAKVFLLELIDKRKKYLKFLRSWDYKRFEWLLEKLDIVYKPPPEHFHWITRKESLQKLTDKYCDDVKQKRLSELRLALENEKPIFLEEKIRCLQFIRDEQSECGQEITVTQDEIDQVKKQLDELKKQNEERNKVDEE